MRPVLCILIRTPLPFDLSYLPSSLEDDGVIAHLALGDAQGGQEAGHSHSSGACGATLMSINVNMRNKSVKTQTKQWRG